MPITSSLEITTLSQSGFTFLGVNMSPKLKGVFHINYLPLLTKIKELEHWTRLPISSLGWINVIKIIILPCLSYLCQSLSCYLDYDFTKSVNTFLSSFIRENSSPRIAFKTLIKPKETRGLGLPDLQLHYWVAQKVEYKNMELPTGQISKDCSASLVINIFKLIM